jgi:hypothetical protein
MKLKGKKLGQSGRVINCRDSGLVQYDQLLQRVQQAPSPHVQAGCAKSFEALKEWC